MSVGKCLDVGLQENFAYEHWDDILDICKQYDVLVTQTSLFLDKLWQQNALVARGP